MFTRIKLLRKANKLTQPKFGEALGVSRDVIGNIELGRVNPNQLMINHIVAVFGVSKVWLETGVGDMYTSKLRENDIIKWAQDISSDDNKNEFTKQLAGILANLDQEGWLALDILSRSVMKSIKKIEPVKN